MEINSKQFLIVAAIGAAAWYLLRGKSGGVIAAAKPSPAPAGNAASIWDGFGVSDFAGMAQAIAGAGNSAAQQVAAPAPAATTASTRPVTVQASAPVETVGGATDTNTGGYLDSKGYWHPADGSPPYYTGGGTYGHLSPERRAGRTDSQMASIFGM